MSDGPKLYSNKPKKAQLKHHQQASAPAPSSSASMSSSTPPGTAGPPPPPQPPNGSFARRYKFMWPLLLAVNFAVGAYLFMRTKKNDVGEGEVPNVPSTAVSSPGATATDTEKPSTPSPIIEPPKPRAPIPVDQQRELFKRMLEEKRKVKPKDSEEKKRIDDEKALLKQFIRAKSIPSL